MSNNVFEIAGVFGSAGIHKGWIAVKEVGGGLHVESDYGLILTPAAARRFADQMYRLADHYEEAHKDA
jgi:hypothetical protein